MAKKNTEPMFWISGNYHDCRKMWDAIRSNVGDPNVITFHCGLISDKTAARATDVVLAMKHRDLFDSRPRIVRLFNLPEDYTIIADYLYLVNSDNILVIDSPVGYRKNRRFITAASSKLYKAIKKRGEAFIFDGW